MDSDVTEIEDHCHLPRNQNSLILSSTQPTSTQILHMQINYLLDLLKLGGFPVGRVVKNLPVNRGDEQEASPIAPCVVKIPWRKWQPTPIFLPGEAHGQMSLASYRPWSHWELDTNKPTEIRTSRAGLGVATHSSILAWRIPWTEEPGRLQSTGSQRVGHD